MARVPSKGSAPEMKLRRLVHSMGYRYRLHDRGLPGSPDMVFRGLKAVIFMHGCFWHRHGSQDCRLARLPKSRTDFWRNKLEGNRLRDSRIQNQLRESGWRVLVVWECELSNLGEVKQRVNEFLAGELA